MPVPREGSTLAFPPVKPHSGEHSTAGLREEDLMLVTLSTTRRVAKLSVATLFWP